MFENRSQKKTTAQNVKEANRIYFDLTAKSYEETDGRRDEKLAEYLRRNLKRAASIAGDSAMLDVGCGAGFVSYCGTGIFNYVVGSDISPKIASEAKRKFSNLDFAAADVDALPFAGQTFNVVTAVAVLHHLHDCKTLFSEAFRVLKKGGVLYTDHDIERRFNQLFFLPLSLYRRFRNERKKYLQSCAQLTDEMYELTEFHRHGVDVVHLRALLGRVGFSDIRFIYHWAGLSRTFDLLRDFEKLPRGFAPSVSIWARK